MLSVAARDRDYCHKQNRWFDLPPCEAQGETLEQVAEEMVRLDRLWPREDRRYFETGKSICDESGNEVGRVAQGPHEAKSRLALPIEEVQTRLEKDLAAAIKSGFWNGVTDSSVATHHADFYRCSKHGYTGRERDLLEKAYQQGFASGRLFDGPYWQVCWSNSVIPEPGEDPSFTVVEQDAMDTGQDYLSITDAIRDTLIRASEMHDPGGDRMVLLIDARKWSTWETWWPEERRLEVLQAATLMRFVRFPSEKELQADRDEEEAHLAYWKRERDTQYLMGGGRF